MPGAGDVLFGGCVVGLPPPECLARGSGAYRRANAAGRRESAVKRADGDFARRAAVASDARALADAIQMKDRPVTEASAGRDRRHGENIRAAAGDAVAEGLRCPGLFGSFNTVSAGKRNSVGGPFTVCAVGGLLRF